VVNLAPKKVYRLNCLKMLHIVYNWLISWSCL